MTKHIENYSSLVAILKENILKSRYDAARSVNKEQLLLYYNIGKMLKDKINTAAWGAKVLAAVADGLQKELPGTKGFSAQNLKKMRLF